MKSITLSSKIIIDKYKKINSQIDQDLSIFLKELGFSNLPIILKKIMLTLKILKNLTD